MASDNLRRLWATTCIAAATTLAVPVLPALPAGAAVKPSPTEVRKKLDKLNEQVDQIVEKYNQAKEDLKAAKAKLKAAKSAATRELASYEQMRKRLAEMAASAYKNGEMNDVAGFLGTGDPQAVLDQTAVLSHLARNRSSEISVFLTAAQRLQRQQAQAQSAYNEVNERTKDLREQREKVEKAIAKQRKALREAGVSDPSAPPSGGGGGDYDGPASGPARKALEYAYAQIGKPYQYGAEGPNSFDCSGLTMKAWAAAGVGIPRTTYTQYAATKRVAKANLQPGDLVFFSGLGHMGLYVGGGKMVHSPSTGKTVQVVDITSGYYLSNYYGAGRV